MCTSRSCKGTSEWLGSEPNGGFEFYGSDYFEQLYEYAVELIKKGWPTSTTRREQMREYRGTTLGKPSRPPLPRPHAEENLDLFERMRAASSPTAKKCCAPRSTWPSRT